MSLQIEVEDLGAILPRELARLLDARLS